MLGPDTLVQVLGQLNRKPQFLDESLDIGQVNELPMCGGQT
jgi:hypothetical protein